MQIHVDTTLIEAAQRIAPVIREHNEEAERERRISPPVLAALHEAGLLRLCTPRSLGGLEADPLTRALVIEEISRHDTAAGWTLTNPLDWAYLCARLPDAGTEEIYSRGANIVIAAQFGRPMQATPAQGGYRITGRAPFVSNCHDANWFATTAMVMAGDPAQAAGEPEVVMAYLPRESCQVIDTWHVMGMRGTGSDDVAVTDVFVPTAVRAGRVFLYDTLRETWEATITGETLSLRHKADIQLAMTHAVQSAVQAVELMYRMAGASGIYTRSPLVRYFRDVQVLRHHPFGAETRYETVGQVYLGLPPDFPFVAF
jgi:alkylation response protein AidB-like acyl-CoA dehydrogenase